ncbi:MAG: hypothetical protein KIT31_37755, partial [Deltaproteobacteria bacterium]|nr:hypothetical protein [Deltaproteobacteria bacterium]
PADAVEPASTQPPDVRASRPTSPTDAAEPAEPGTRASRPTTPPMDAPPARAARPTAPPMDALDTGWDLGDEDPTAGTADEPAQAAAEAPATSTPSSAEMAGDGAVEGDGIDTGWD